jgi:hypothetical protein
LVLVEGWGYRLAVCWDTLRRPQLHGMPIWTMIRYGAHQKPSVGGSQPRWMENENAVLLSLRRA